MFNARHQGGKEQEGEWKKGRAGDEVNDVSGALWLGGERRCSRGEGVLGKDRSKHALVLDGLAVPQREVNSGTIPRNEVGRWLSHCPSILFGLEPPKNGQTVAPLASCQRVSNYESQESWELGGKEKHLLGLVQGQPHSRELPASLSFLPSLVPPDTGDGARGAQPMSWCSCQLGTYVRG